MAYDAAGIASQDLAAGLDFFHQTAQQSKFPWLSANLVRKSSGQPIFAPSITKKTGEITIGVIGITNPSGSSVLKEEDDAMILPWREILPKLAKDLALQCDLVILLSNQTFSENQKIAETIPQVHLIIQSGTSPTNLPPQKFNNTLIMQTEKQGKHLGELQVNWHKSGIWGTDKTKELQQKKSLQDSLNWRLKRYRKKGDPEKIFLSEPDKLNAYHNLVKEHERLTKETKNLEAEIEQERKQGVKASTYTNHFYAMETSLPDHPEVARIVTATTEEVNLIGMKIARMKKPAGSSAQGQTPLNFVGADTCVTCHADQKELWKTTRHAEAYKTLIDRNQQFNLDCIPCHVTGVITGEEPFALSLQADLQQVGCEACHGAGRQHITNPKNSPLQKKPTSETCLRCHTPDQDDSFDYEKDIKRLGCGVPIS